MAKEKTTIRFWLRTDRKNKDCTSPIHLVYQIKGQRKYYSVPEIKMLEINWNAEDQQAVFIDKKRPGVKEAQSKEPFDSGLLLTTDEAKEINKKLSKVVSDIEDIEDRFKLDSKEFSPQSVIGKLNEIKNHWQKKMSLVKTFPPLLRNSKRIA